MQTVGVQRRARHAFWVKRRTWFLSAAPWRHEDATQTGNTTASDLCRLTNTQKLWHKTSFSFLMCAGSEGVTAHPFTISLESFQSRAARSKLCGFLPPGGLSVLASFADWLQPRDILQVTAMCLEESSLEQLYRLLWKVFSYIRCFQNTTHKISKKKVKNMFKLKL